MCNLAIDTAKIEEHIHGILLALGDDPSRAGLKDTPKRVAKMYQEIFEGMNYTNADIAQQLAVTFDEDTIAHSSDVIQVKDIEAFSYCEHHLALMYDLKVSVAYIPQGKVLGLSKIARIVDMASRRLQLQERLGHDIAEIITMATGSADVAVTIEACHSCMTARGIQKTSAKTYTTTYCGQFAHDGILQARIR